MFAQVFALDRDARGLERLANLAQRQAVDDLDGVVFFLGAPAYPSMA